MEKRATNTANAVKKPARKPMTKQQVKEASKLDKSFSKHKGQNK